LKEEGKKGGRKERRKGGKEERRREEGSIYQTARDTPSFYPSSFPPFLLIF